MSNKIIRVYDGRGYCPDCDKCPVVDLIEEKEIVKISDPDKPENGSFTMTVSEYNALLKHANKIS